MPIGQWKIYTRAKRALGRGGAAMASGGVTLGAGVFKLCLYRPSASANILRTSNGGISTYASVGCEVSARGGYVTGGKTEVRSGSELPVEELIAPMASALAAAVELCRRGKGELINPKE